MCNADVTLLTWDWVQGHNIPYPNFNTRHQCRNYKNSRLSNTLCISLDRRLLVSKIQLTCTFPYI
ncbi:hypothetical protein BDR07DRAFT_1434846 [Suillus spraguei]|nr:hypothetical protein BDR07DRAFT_1434846 [Suillus spraguei]